MLGMISAGALKLAAVLGGGAAMRPFVRPRHRVPELAELDRSPRAPAAEVLPERGPQLTAERRHLNTHEAVLRFATWMRDWGFCGWHAPDDIIAFYQWFCDEEGIEEMTHDQLREHFASAPGVTRARRRLNDTTDPAIVRLQRRLKVDRIVLYRVASHEEMAERAHAEAEAAHQAAAAKDARRTGKATAGRTRPALPAHATPTETVPLRRAA